MPWHDQFEVEDEKVDSRWLALIFAIVLIAVVSDYYLYDGGEFRVLFDLARKGVTVINR